ncbi:Arm DNA-binding domain-containing protein [Paracoccus aminovorans]|nr:Arm DNA-binding domain-containing protein [Paracoccus aminovorans]
MPLTDAKLCNLKPREKPFKANDGHGLYVLVSTTGAPMAI